MPGDCWMEINNCNPEQDQTARFRVKTFVFRDRFFQPIKTKTKISYLLFYFLYPCDGGGGESGGGGGGVGIHIDFFASLTTAYFVIAYRSGYPVYLHAVLNYNVPE